MFTATATEEVKNDILCTLSLADPEVVITGFDRKNLYYSVENIRRKDEFIMEYIEKHPTESGIIYCATRKNVDNLFELLFKRGVPVTRYHAGLTNETRKKNQDDFIYDRTPVIIATNAFGMGIDKSNVRYVIHYNMPPFTLHFTIFISFCTQTVSGIIKLNHRLGEVLYLINAVFFNNTIVPHAHTQFH